MTAKIWEWSKNLRGNASSNVATASKRSVEVAGPSSVPGDDSRGESFLDVSKEPAYPTFPPPAPKQLLSNPSFYNQLLSQRQYYAPKNENDTPLYGLFRMYEHLLLNRTTGLRNELETFWFNRWPVSSIPDPKDDLEPDRYAVFAAIPALIVLAYNTRIELGIPRHAEAVMTMEEIEEYRNADRLYENVPAWSKTVPPCKKVLSIPHEDGEKLESFDDLRASKQLAEKNILCWQPHIHFV